MEAGSRLRSVPVGSKRRYTEADINEVNGRFAPVTRHRGDCQLCEGLMTAGLGAKIHRLLRRINVNPRLESVAG